MGILSPNDLNTREEREQYDALLAKAIEEQPELRFVGSAPIFDDDRNVVGLTFLTTPTYAPESNLEQAIAFLNHLKREAVKNHGTVFLTPADAATYDGACATLRAAHRVIPTFGVERIGVHDPRNLPMVMNADGTVKMTGEQYRDFKAVLDDLFDAGEIEANDGSHYQEWIVDGHLVGVHVFDADQNHDGTIIVTKHRPMLIAMGLILPDDDSE